MVRNFLLVEERKQNNNLILNFDLVKKLIISNQPYLNTTTSKQVENTKAFELTIIKELGKLTLVTSG